MHSDNIRAISGQTSWDTGSLRRSLRIVGEANHSSRRTPVCTFHITHAIHDCKPSLSKAYMGGGATISHCPITSLGIPHSNKDSKQLSDAMVCAPNPETCATLFQMIKPRTTRQRSEVKLARAQNQREDALASCTMQTATRTSCREKSGRGASTLAHAPLRALVR